MMRAEDEMQGKVVTFSCGWNKQSADPSAHYIMMTSVVLRMKDGLSACTEAVRAGSRSL